MDNNYIEHLLSTLEVVVEATAICEIERGVRLVLEPKSSIEFHYVLDGTMHLTVSGLAPLVCRAGTLVIVPSGASQSLAADSDPNRDLCGADCCSAIGDGLLLYDAAGGKPGDLRLFCGLITPNTLGSFGLLERVIEPIKDLSDAPIVRQAFAAMLNEIGNPRLGTRAVVGTLMKICLMKVMQSHLDTPENRRVLLASVRAPQLLKVIAEVRTKPEAVYDMETLTAISGMGRSTFAVEFLKTYRMTPMRFVTTTRLHRAAELLRCTTMPIKMVAGAVGFASRSHFSRAFRDVYGIGPLNFRATSQSSATKFVRTAASQQASSASRR
jgi:AraC family transcriptional regulator, activator of mtrCDE